MLNMSKREFQISVFPNPISQKPGLPVGSSLYIFTSSPVHESVHLQLTAPPCPPAALHRLQIGCDVMAPWLCIFAYSSILHIPLLLDFLSTYHLLMYIMFILFCQFPLLNISFRKAEFHWKEIMFSSLKSLKSISFEHSRHSVFI